jgi:hypothetical protein
VLLPCCSGLLASISASLPAFAQRTQQQLAAGYEAAGWEGPLTQLLACLVLNLLDLWKLSISDMPSLVPVMVRTLLPLVQQLQACAPQLLQAAAAAATVQTAESVTSMLQKGFIRVQQAVLDVLGELLQGEVDSKLPPPDVSAQEQVFGLLRHPAVATTLLHNLIAYTALLHQRDVAYQQQQQQQQEDSQQDAQKQQRQQQQQHDLITVASNDHDSTSQDQNLQQQQQQQQQQPKKQQQQQPKQQLRADLLPIPAFHQDMLQLLPGGQGYLDAAAAAVGRQQGSQGAPYRHVMLQLYTQSCLYVLNRCLLLGCMTHSEQHQSPVLCCSCWVLQSSSVGSSSGSRKQICHAAQLLTR